MVADDANEGSLPTNCVGGLTCENMVQHQSRYGEPVVYYRTNNGNPFMRMEAAGIYLIGGVTPSSAARPKTFGMALAMVAIFCCFPGISMIAPIGRVGITNQTVTGIVFIFIAGTLSIASGILFTRGSHLSRKMREMEKQQRLFSADDANQALLSNRDECCVDNITPIQHHSHNEIFCECDEIQLANKIAQSFTLSRYFANLDTATGPFELDHEAMVKATENSLQGMSLPLHRSSLAKRYSPKENSSSTDSAIYVDSDTQSVEAMIVV